MSEQSGRTGVVTVTEATPRPRRGKRGRSGATAGRSAVGKGGDATWPDQRGEQKSGATRRAGPGAARRATSGLLATASPSRARAAAAGRAGAAEARGSSSPSSSCLVVVGIIGYAWWASNDEGPDNAALPALGQEPAEVW